MPDYPTIKIYVGTTYLKVKVGADGYVIIPSAFGPDKLSIVCIHPFLRTELTEYDFDYRTNKPFVKYRYFDYDKHEQTLTMPVHFLKYLKDFLARNGILSIDVEIPVFEYDKVDFKLLGNFIAREDQKPKIDYLVNDPNHMRALEMQTGCLSGDSEINFNRAKKGFSLNIATAYRHRTKNRWDKNIKTFVRSYTGNRINLHEIEDIVFSGVRSLFKIILENGRFIKCTIDHEIMTSEGWIEAGNIINKEVMCDDILSNNGIPSYSKAITIIYVGEERTYDIVCKAPHHNFVANGIVVHNSGKTACTIFAMQEIALRTFIIMPAFLIDQWLKSIFNMIDIGRDEIFIFQGNKSILQAYMMEDELPKIFLASAPTLFSYMTTCLKDKNLPLLSEIFRKLRIGFKAIDEIHMRFFTNAMIDLQSNILHNIYLSATYMRSEKKSDAIFKKTLPTQIRYSKGVYDKYVDIYEVTYNLGHISDKRTNSKRRGYSQIKYEQYLLIDKEKCQIFFEEVLKPLIVDHYLRIRKPEQKLLIIVDLKEFAHAVHKFITSLSEFYNVSCAVYLAEHDESVLHNSSVVISTKGSTGTGTDIKNLLTLIQTTSFASETLTYQLTGRLRKLANGDTPRFLYLVNRKVASHLAHRDKRSIIYDKIAKDYKKIEL